MKYLLDLNFTLTVRGQYEKPISPYIRQIEKETYREWLVDFLKNEYVILITARGERYKEASLESIKLKTGWQPQEAYFNEINASPPECKEHLLLNYIFPQHGKDAKEYFGIESNPKTRDMYLKFGIDSCSADNFKLKI